VVLKYYIKPDNTLTFNLLNYCYENTLVMKNLFHLIETSKSTQRILTICCLFLIGTTFTYSQKNIIRGTLSADLSAEYFILDDAKYGFEYERILNSNLSFTVGYRRNTTFYEAQNGKWFFRGTRGENIGDRVLLSVRFNLLALSPSLKKISTNSEIRTHDENSSSKVRGRLYLAPVFSYGVHDFEYDQGVRIQVEGGSYPSSINADLKVYGIGLNLGYSKTWGPINLDFGFNLTKNSMVDGSTGLEYFDGEIQKFPSDLNGLRPDLYVGFYEN